MQMETLNLRNIDDFITEVSLLIDSYRTRCLWFFVPDYLPTDLSSALRALSYLKKHGDRAVFVRTSELKKMAFTKRQFDICKIISQRLRESGEAYVAVGVALNKLLNTPRISRDIDLFHDTNQGVETSWTQDSRYLDEAHYTMIPMRDAPGFPQLLLFAQGYQVCDLSRYCGTNKL